MVWVNGFWQNTCLPFRIAAAETAMQVVGGTNNNRIQIFFLFQKFAKVVVGGAAMVLARLLLPAIVGFDNFLAGLAPGNSAGCLQRMGQLDGIVGTEPVPARSYSQQFAHAIAELVRIPLRMAGAAFIGIANGDT